MTNEANADIGRCDECGSEDGTRQLAPYYSTLAWLCGECRTRLALIESFKGLAS